MTSKIWHNNSDSLLIWDKSQMDKLPYHSTKIKPHFMLFIMEGKPEPNIMQKNPYRQYRM